MNRWNSESHQARLNGRVVTEEDEVNHDYDDIINLPHYEPKHHPRMSMWNRAAQFAPFAELNRKMELLLSKLSEQPHVTIEYFVSDEHKDGGSYQSYTGNVKRIDEYEKCIEFTDGKKVPLDVIREIKID